jgi:TRAP-type C4-dicarboxylate transport system substrate-binding protein
MKKFGVFFCILFMVGSIGLSTLSCSDDNKTTTTNTSTSTSTSTTTTANTVIIKMASASTGNYIDNEQAFVDAFNARCAPDYQIEYYPAGQMIAFPEMLDAIRSGAADMGDITPNAFSAYDPRLAASELPFLFNNLAAHREAVPELEPLYAQILEEKFNQKLLALHNYTGMALISTKAVRTLEDWDGLLVQSISPLITDMFEALGAAAVSGQPYTESYSLLEKATADAVLTAPATIRIYALTDVADYMTSAYTAAAVNGFSINLDVWNSLPADIQDILIEEAGKASDFIDQWLVDEWETDHQAIRDAGVEIIDIPADEVAIWREACQSIYDTQLEEMPDFMQQVIDIAERANANNPIE